MALTSILSHRERKLLIAKSQRRTLYLGAEAFNGFAELYL
jgi:hypothetical protein